MEIELKLLIDAADVAALRRHPLLARQSGARPRVQRLTTTYFDTPDLFFRKHGAALRVRRVARQWIQTLKAGGRAVAGLHEREEWESRVAGARPDLAALRARDSTYAEWAKAWSDTALSDQLVPIFTTRFRRTIWLLRVDPGVEIEVALDQGAVEHGAARVPLSELELELKSGDPAKLFEFALDLHTSIPLRVSNVSKAERGFALLAPGPPPVLKAAPLLLHRRSSVADGLQAIVANCLLQVQGNESGVTQGDAVESVHQMRVGVRRLRCAQRLFGRVAPAPAALHADLKWLAEELGAARDWEVLAWTSLAEVQQACPGETGLAQLRIAAQSLASGRRKRAAGAVNSQRYSRLLLALGHWLRSAYAQESAPPARQAELAAPLAKYSARQLKGLHATLLRCGSVESAAPEVRHQARKVARRVRYAAEFFDSLYSPKSMRTYVKSLIALQDELGRLNDAAVARALLGDLVQAEPGLAQSAGFVNGFLSSGARRGARRLARRWRRFERIVRPHLR